MIFNPFMGSGYHQTFGDGSDPACAPTTLPPLPSGSSGYTVGFGSKWDHMMILGTDSSYMWRFGDDTYVSISGPQVSNIQYIGHLYGLQGEGSVTLQIKILIFDPSQRLM